MALSLEEKYKIIYAHEEAFSFSLAKLVVKKPETSVWMILLPILFVHHAYRINQYKAGVKAFAKGILSSKIKALDKTFKEVSTGEPLSYGVKEYFPDVELQTEHEKTLAQKQITVLRIMETHFKALLNAEGRDLVTLHRWAYGCPDLYRDYFKRLAAAEKALNRYLAQHVHTSEEAAAVVKAIEKHCETLREEELKHFF